MRKVTDITQERRDEPGQEQIRDIANEAASRARLAELRAIAVVMVRNGQVTTGKAFAGLSRTDRLLLIAELDNLKASLRD